MAVAERLFRLALPQDMDIFATVMQKTAPDIPLVVDLDGTLVCDELPMQAFKNYLRPIPSMLQFRSLLAMSPLERKSFLMSHYVQHHPAHTLSLHPMVLRLMDLFINMQKEVYLATGNMLWFALKLVQEHPQLQGKVPTKNIFASFSKKCPAYVHTHPYVAAHGHLVDHNLVSSSKASLLKQVLRSGFIYVGNSMQDLPVWRASFYGRICHIQAIVFHLFLLFLL